MNFETENIEFKSEFTEEIYKEVIAFANTDGGIIYVGIDNDGNVLGLSDVDKEYTRITNGIRDAIMPDVTMFVRYTVQDNKVVRITVSEGSNKPYYLKSKGLRSGGVFVRQGSTKAPASPEQIRAMIKLADGDVYEEMRALNQELSFASASSAFQKYHVEFSPEKYKALGMLQNDTDIYTNLAYIISDQCEHTIKVAVFGDEAKTVFKDSKEFDGSVFKQLEDAFSYLRLCNRTTATFNGLERVEKSDYPEVAVREALLNAIVHRDYSFSGSIIINITESEMEVISIGGLLPGLSPEDIKSGISQPRNRDLAEMFHRLRLIESYGTGIRKIYYLYEACHVKPKIEVTPNTFKIILPNQNNSFSRPYKYNDLALISPSKAKILSYIMEHGQIKEDEVGELLGVGKTRRYTILREMCEAGLIKMTGRGKSKIYTAIGD